MKPETFPANAQMRATLIESQRRVLELIAASAPLEKILERLVLLIEEQLGDLRCSVLLIDRATRQLRFAAAPSFSEEYKREVEPLLRIGPDSGACGTAAYSGRPVYTRDTAADPLWQRHTSAAARTGVRAIWSTPILSRTGDVLGTFAIHYGKPCLPSDDHVQLIDLAVKLARIAVEAKCDDEMLDVVFEDVPDGMIVIDCAGSIARANRAFAAMLGYVPADLPGRNVAELGTAQDYPTLMRRLLPLPDRELVNYRHYRAKDGRLLRVRERCTLRKDAKGNVRSVLIRIERVIGTGPDPREQLSAREIQVLELVLEGLTSKAIGARLHISSTSVDTYRSRIMVKLGAAHLPGLVRVALEHGLAA